MVACGTADTAAGGLIPYAPPPPPPGPPAPAITGVSDDTGCSGTDRITKDTTPALSGTAPAGSTVTVYRRGTADPTPVAVGTAAADGGGNWSFPAPSALAGGSYEFTTTATSGGQASAPSAPLVLHVDTTPPTITLDVDPTTYWTAPEVRAVVTDLWKVPTTGTLTLDIDLNNDGDFADPGEAGYATAALSSGVAVFKGYAPLAVGGTVRVRVRGEDCAGNPGASDPTTVVIQTSPTGEQLTDWTPDVVAGGYRRWTAPERPPDDPADPRVSVGLRHVSTGAATAAVPLGLSPADAGPHPAEVLYSSDAAAPAAVVRAVVRSDNAKGAVTGVTGVLTWDGVAGGTITYGVGQLVPGGDWVFAAQAPAGQATGRHTYTLQLTLDYPGTADDVTRSVSGATFVVNASGSAFGAGWSLTSADALVDIPASGPHPAGKLRVSGAGGWWFYADTGSGYASPVGDPGTLTAVTGGYEYRSETGWKRVFDTAGRMTRWVSADGAETVTYTYDGSGNLTAMKAPGGAVATFAYSGGKVSTVTAPATG